MDKIDFEQELLEDLSSQFAKYFDSSLLKTIEVEHLIKQGWHYVDAGRYYTMEKAVEVARWAEENCGRHICYGTTFVFKDSQDAVLFKLRWAA